VALLAALWIAERVGRLAELRPIIAIVTTGTPHA